MFRKAALFALAASVSFGAALLAPTASEAGPVWKGKHIGKHLKHHHHFHGHFHPHRPHWQVRYRRPVVYAAAPVVYAARPAVAAPRTCLTKEYTREGAVLFRDLCTNEMAMNPPSLPPQQTSQVMPVQQQAAAPEMQAPVQTMPQQYAPTPQMQTR